MKKDKKQNVWSPFKFLVGSWKGASQGCSGKSKSEQDYRFVLNGKFLQARNKSTFALQAKNPKREVHEEVGFFSYDSNRKRFVLRQFHVEGFVNQYVLQNLAEDGKTMVSVAESIESIPSGWRAKETYKVLNDDEFTEVFELPAPGKDFEVYTKSHFWRKV